MSFPRGPVYAQGLSPIGYCDLGHRSAFKLAMHRAGDRWLLYTGTFWEPGFNIIDVTDPTAPRLVRHVPLEVPAGSMTLQMQVADGVMITSVETTTSVVGDGTEPQAPPSPFEGFTVWSLQDPENPTRAGHFSTGGDGTHRNFYGVAGTCSPPAFRSGIGATSCTSATRRTRSRCHGGGLKASGEPGASRPR